MKLKKLAIDGVEYELCNIVIIIGANNTGKTTFLNDVYESLVYSYERDSEGDFVSRTTSETMRTGLVGENFFSYEYHEVDTWLQPHKYWRRAGGQTSEDLYRSSAHVLQWERGEEAAIPESLLVDLRDTTEASLKKDNWLVRFKLSHIGFIRVDDRLTIASNIGVIDVQSPDNPYALYLRESVLRAINIHLQLLFDKVLIPLKTSMSNFSLLILKRNDAPEAKWANSNRFEAEINTISNHSKLYNDHPTARIERQSHGTRAAMALLLSLTDKTRKILFIDEPEAHIYPAARKYIANVITRSKSDKQFFIVTHDVESLETLLTSRKDMTLIKLSHDHRAKVVNFDSSARLMTAAELKNSKAVRAGFYDAVIFVEGNNDRYVYDYIISRKKMMPNTIEYGLIDCDGGDRIASSVKFAKEIGTAMAIIVDFDLITDPMKKVGDVKEIKLNIILKTLGADESLLDNVRAVRLMLVGRPHNKKGLACAALSSEEKIKVSNLLEELARLGVFVVPQGELFDWFSPAGKVADITPENLRNKYANNSSKYDDLTQFLQRVCSYVCDQLSTHV